ncbi:lymphoid enhancer-binding factor 1-like [Nothobranchius furzeri]|uniref:Lymphoid enhancer-binding factor 1-like n=1 Tax=Nothobranchius furzeri TaxID=105023 RepID=A0A9D3BQY1_NOTFU|nr:transcription factor 7-like [Nothobranchius furzeri]KAF7217811.1 lymphoid enhancer-binding factor 1-like [Nothobranchius furzeri]
MEENKRLLSFDRYMEDFGGEREFFSLLDEIFKEHLPIPFPPPSSPLEHPPSPSLPSFSPASSPPPPVVVSSLPSPHTPTAPSLPSSLLPGTPPAAPASAPVSNPNKRKREPKQEDRPYVKKPPNAFMIFLRDQRPKVVAELNLTDSAAVNAIVGQRWRELSPEQQNVYFDQAHKEQRLHEQQHPAWVPNYNRKAKGVKEEPAASSAASSSPGGSSRSQ